MHRLPVPLWLWIAAIAVVAVVAVVDFAWSTRRRHEPRLRDAALATAGVVALGALFGGVLTVVGGSRAAGQFFAGWLTEYSLSLDNLFVFVLLLGRSALPTRQRSQVLLVGIGLALLLRGVFIAGGAAALNRFDWTLYLFAAVLLITAGRLAYSSATQPGLEVSQPGLISRWLAARGRAGVTAPLVALVVAIGVTDLIFAMDSIPAIFGLTRDPYLVLTANALALLGLRQLYFLIGGLLDRLVHLSAGLSAILTFIGVKLLAEALGQSGVHRVGPVPVPQIGTTMSLCVIGGVLLTVTTTSLISTRRRVSPSPAARLPQALPPPARPSSSHPSAARSVRQPPPPGHACPP